jgi:hypothetical protein
MRTFKLNYLAFSLIVAMTSSCVNEEALGDADKSNAKVNNEFTFSEDIHNYEINGKLVYDRTEIATAAGNAWHVLYDYPNKKVSISTTQQEFEKLKNADAELKASFEKEPEMGENAEEDLLSTDIKFIPLGFPENKIPINSKNKNELSTDMNKMNLNFNLLGYSNPWDKKDTDDVIVHSIYKYGDGHCSYINTDLKTSNGVSGLLYTVYNTRPGQGHSNGIRDIHECFVDQILGSTQVIVNHSHKTGKQLQFFEKDNFKGRSQTHKVGRNGRFKVTTHTSFGAPGRREYAQSLKVTNI